MSTPVLALATSFNDIFGGRDPETRAAFAAAKQLNDYVKAGDLDAVVRLLEALPQKPSEAHGAFCILATNAFWRACEQGYTDCARAVMDHVTQYSKEPKQFHNGLQHALSAAISGGHHDTAQWLLPHWHNHMSGVAQSAYHKKSLLLSAVESGHLEMVKLVLPMVTQKSARTEALRLACERKNHVLFDHLYPLANPQQALTYMRKRKTLSSEDRALLEQAMDAQEQHALLSQEVEGVVDPVKSRRLKM